MKPVFPGGFTLVVLGLLFAVVVFAMRVVQPEWSASPRWRRAVRIVFGATLAGLFVWMLGRVFGQLGMARLGAGAAYIGVMVIFPAALVMPLAAGIDRLGGYVLRRREAPASASPSPSPSPSRAHMSRRDVLRLGTASLPAAAAAGGASGFVQAGRDPKIPVIRLAYPDLHPDLDGLRILQLSDLHLGACLGLEDLRRALEAARREKPDLVVVTGDLADDVTLIPEALRMIAAVGAPLGALASLGNHEYLHDIRVTRPLYEASPLPLLVGSGKAIRVGGATLFVGGADDPMHMRGNIPKFVSTSIAEAAASAPDGCDFRLLLCHRPEGFGPATLHGFDLTLSGHTHGGQVGLFGRSVLEWLRPEISWWGTYTKKRPPDLALAGRGPGGLSRLYTTSGFGHWFPFRVGCPTEMPIVVLHSGSSPVA